jgi:acyl-CoA thioester hydrolase
VSPYVHHIRVRYGECDMQKVVFNANYLAYCDDAAEGWVRAKGTPTHDLGWDFMLKKSTIEWSGAATVNDEIDIAVQATRWGTTSFDVTFTGTVGERPIFTNVITYVGVKLGTLETMAPPEDVKLALSS